jgi:hypothetical protein
VFPKLRESWRLRTAHPSSGREYWERVSLECEADENCRKMRVAAHELGREFESKPYNELLQPAEVLSVSRIFNGDLLHFAAEAYRVDKNGDIHFCIDVSGLPTKTSWLPSYRFIKRRDGSIVPD